MTPHGDTFQFSPTFGIGQRVWHRGDRESSGVVEAVVLYDRAAFTYRVSWSTHEFTEERETSLTDDPPVFDGHHGGDN